MPCHRKPGLSSIRLDGPKLEKGGNVIRHRRFLAWLKPRVLLCLVATCVSVGPVNAQFQLESAFPISDSEIRAVFSEAVDPVSAGDASKYSFASGLTVLGVTFDASLPERMLIETTTMDPNAGVTDTLEVVDIDSLGGDTISLGVSPLFVQGILTPRHVQLIEEGLFPPPLRAPTTRSLSGLTASQRA